MNSISWFLYLSDILQNLTIVLVIIGIGGGIVAGFALLFGFVEDEPPARKMGFSLLKWVIPVFFVSALIPGKNTLYAIAASEVGERVIKSEQVQGIASDATKALHHWIKKQLEPSKDRQRTDD